ncbi:MAG: hypothetical protein COB38_01690 [Gammaproteobacteria bacterium]|nr:MAG: hypothetical protein COB38_01690 [Gammaproteobacteria bacterium]
MTDYFDLWKLLAGLGLFLFGMSHLESALKLLAGKRFRQFIKNSTDNPISSVFGGIISTAIVQSSSLVGLIVLAFVGAGIIPLTNAIGIVLGSNLGTTFTGWIVTTLGFKLDFTTIIYPLLGIGGLSYGLFKGRIKLVSQLLLSFALLLMGLDFMKDSVSALTQQADISILKGYPLIVYLLVGALFTAIIQSSSASMILTLSALYGGIISLPAAAALIIGADLGTTSTVMLGSLQGAVAKRRLAMAHMLFNLSVDTVAFIFLLPILLLIEWLTISDPLYALVAFHSIFNLLGILLYLPFLKQFTKFLERWITEKSEYIDRYIHNVPTNVTDAAVEALTQEIKHLLFLVIHLNLRFLRSHSKILEVDEQVFKLPESLTSSSTLEQYLAIKKLEGNIIRYAIKIQVEMTDANFDQDTLQQYTQRIEKLTNIARSGVYAIKSLKDIDENLESFQVIDNKYLRQLFEELNLQAQTTYQNLFECLLLSVDKQLLKKELTSLKLKSQEFHNEFTNRLYHQMNKVKFMPLEPSTLLNVNKEILTSELALISALELL